jgi:hypothetical protein
MKEEDIPETADIINKKPLIKIPDSPLAKKFKRTL